MTGVVDAVSFLGLGRIAQGEPRPPGRRTRGRIFTANMTGNVVFLRFAMAGAAGSSAARSAAALAAFAAGGILAGQMETGMRAGPRPRWAGTAFAVEAALLLASAVIATGAGTDIGLYAVIVLTALAMGIRNGTVRKLGVPDLTTTVLTLGITGLAADSSLAGGANPG